MDEQLSVHDVTFLGSSPAELQGHWTELGGEVPECDRHRAGRS